MAGIRYLADTNILLRLMKSNDPEFPLVRRAAHVLEARGDQLCYIPQNMVEFWNACTRPADKNGYGLPPMEADRRAQRIERAFTLLPDNEQSILNGGASFLSTLSLAPRCTMLAWSLRCTSTPSRICSH